MSHIPEDLYESQKTGSSSGTSYGTEPQRPDPNMASNSMPDPESSTKSQAQPQMRTCRICLDTTTKLVDPELGRMISPCKCRGSSRYVHQECLNLWRTRSANPQAYYKCPTCKFEYRLTRLVYSRWIASSAMQIGITLLILFVTVYLLGFVGERIMEFYLPFHSIYSIITGNGFSVFGYNSPSYERTTTFPKESVGFVEHMLRGFTSLGFLGVAKVFSPHWIKLIFRENNGGRRAGGRDRVAQITWIFVVWGVVNFLIVIWKFVRNRTKGFLDGIAHNVLDIQEDEPVNE